MNKLNNPLLEILHPDPKIRKRIKAAFCLGNELFANKKGTSNERQSVITLKKTIEKCDGLLETAINFEEQPKTLQRENIQSEISILICEQLKNISTQKNITPAQRYSETGS